MADQDSAMADLRLALSSLTVPDLQRQLQERNLKKSGKKEQLINRLLEAMKVAELAKQSKEESTENVTEPESSVNTKEEKVDSTHEEEKHINDAKEKEQEEKEVKVAEEASQPQEEKEHEVLLIAGNTEEDNIEQSKNISHDVEAVVIEHVEEHSRSPEIPYKECERKPKEDYDQGESVEESEMPCDEITISIEEAEKEKMDVNEEEPEIEVIMKPLEEDQTIVPTLEEDKENEEQSREEPKVEKEEERSKGDYVSIPERRYSAPVQLKKRRDPSLDMHESTTPGPSAKKRRWGFSAKKSTVTISSESIKALIPDVKLSPSALDADVDFSEDDENREEGEIDDSVEKEEEKEDEQESEAKPESPQVQGDGDAEEKDKDPLDAFKEEEEEEKETPKRVGEGDLTRSGKRVVRLSGSRKVFLKSNNESPAIEGEDTVLKPHDITVQVERKPIAPITSADQSADERERSPMEPKNPPNQSIHVQNLVRPFTVRYLQEQIRKTGTIVEGQFWIDKIKSHCYVTLETDEEALATIKALDGVRWPQGSPKVLAVDYALNSDMYKETAGAMGNLPVKEETISEPLISEEKPVPPPEEEKDFVFAKEVKEKKVKKKEEKVEQKADRKKKEQSPTKLLDDLFRKTKATPCIYWLPLSEAQVAQREKEREERLVERRQAREQELAANERDRIARQNARQSKTEGAEPISKQGARPEKFSNNQSKAPYPSRGGQRNSNTRSPNRSPQRRPYRVHSPVGGPLSRRS